MCLYDGGGDGCLAVLRLNCILREVETQEPRGETKVLGG